MSERAEREHRGELSPELVDHLRRSSAGLPIEELMPLTNAELVELLMARTRLGSLVRDEMTSWLADGEGTTRADDLRAYIAAGQDARDALTVYQHATRHVPANATREGTHGAEHRMN